MSEIVKKIIHDINNNTSSSLYGEVFELKVILDKDKLIDTVISQQGKGLKKYGHNIDDCPNDKYDWVDMAYEEIADFLIYKEKNKQQNE